MSNYLQDQQCMLYKTTHYQAGEHTVNWEGLDKDGYPVTSGIYFYELQAGNFVQIRKMTLLR